MLFPFVGALLGTIWFEFHDRLDETSLVNEDQPLIQDENEDHVASKDGQETE